jgi:DNA-directed RNA polymerase specialized sigma24 family protein
LVSTSGRSDKPDRPLVRVQDVAVRSDVGFETLFREEYARLVALGIGMSGDTEVAAELAQEVFVRAYRTWPNVADLDVPAAWLRRVMINLHRNEHSLAQFRPVTSVYPGPRPTDGVARANPTDDLERAVRAEVQRSVDADPRVTALALWAGRAPVRVRRLPGLARV